MTEHFTRLVRGDVVESSWPIEVEDGRIWIATCSCGWAKGRQLERAARELLARHVAVHSAPLRVVPG